MVYRILGAAVLITLALPDPALWAQQPTTRRPAQQQRKAPAKKVTPPKGAAKRPKPKSAPVPEATPEPKQAPKSSPKTSTLVRRPARETAIDRLVVSMFKARVANPKLAELWNKEREDFQQIFVVLLNEQSYLQAVPSGSEYALDEGKDLITDEARESGVDGVLVGEYRGNTLELAIRSGATGRTLSRWTIPAGKIDEKGQKEIINQAVNAIILGFPYRGYIVTTKGDQAKLNLGRRAGVQVGTLLDIFEFTGNKPTFSSPTVPLGVIQVTKISPEEAIGTVTKSYRPITPYAKVAFSKITESASDTSRTRTHSSFWISAGGEFNALDTQISDETVSFRKRQYQIPISPSIGFGLGYKRLAFSGMTGAGSNASNKVNFLSATGSFELFTIKKGNWHIITSLGGYYNQYSVTVQPGATLPLITSTTYSPYYEIRGQLTTSQDTRVFANFGMYWPIFSSDAENGKSNFLISGGLGLSGGLRLNVSRRTAIEAGAQGRLIRQTMETTKFESAESTYGFFARLLFLL